MKNLLKVVLGLSLVIALTGCEGEGVNVYCDKEKGVEYLIFKGYKSAGMTIRTNNDGSVSLCR